MSRSWTYAISTICLISILSCVSSSPSIKEHLHFDKENILQAAQSLVDQDAITITEYVAPRSKGSRNEYYSEGPYWWPNPDQPSSPYIRRDGKRNPHRFDHHRQALKQMEDVVTTLAAAYLIDPDTAYIDAIESHLHAWMIDSTTMMYPSLEHAQAIPGIIDGRGIGIIDIIGLIDVANALVLLTDNGALSSEIVTGSQRWFAALTQWLVTSSHGKDEADNGNNHSTWWGAQVASYINYTGQGEYRPLLENHYERYLDHQVSEEGSYPEELARTRPWHYTLYNLRAWCVYAHAMQSEECDAWGNSLLMRSVDYVLHYVHAADTWPHSTDIEADIVSASLDLLYLIPSDLRPVARATWLKHQAPAGSRHVRNFLADKLYDL